MLERDIYLLSPSPKEDIISLPIIQFSIVADTIDFSGIDILMFTSKQAVRSVNEIDKNWKKIPAIAVGDSTARMIKSLGGQVIHQTQVFYAKALCEEIIRSFKEKKILYLRPRETSFDSKSFLQQKKIDLREQIVYETRCLHHALEEKPSNGAIIIFTSPSTIRCFLKNFGWDASYTAVVIGEATRGHLPADVQYEVADIPQIEACISKAKQILLTSNSK